METKLLKPIFSTKEITVRVPLTKDGMKALRKNPETPVELLETTRKVTFCQGVEEFLGTYTVQTGISIMNPEDTPNQERANLIAKGRAEKNPVNYTETMFYNFPPKIVREELLVWTEKYVERNLLKFILKHEC